jgi:hypothetical protein
MLSSPRKKKRSHPHLISPPFPFLFPSSHSPNIHLAPIFSTTTVDFYRQIPLNSSNRHYSHILIIVELLLFFALAVAAHPDGLKATRTLCLAFFFAQKAKSTSIVVTKLKILRLFRDSTFPTARTCTPHSGHSQLVSPRHLPTLFPPATIPFLTRPARHILKQFYWPSLYLIWWCVSAPFSVYHYRYCCHYRRPLFAAFSTSSGAFGWFESQPCLRDALSDLGFLILRMRISVAQHSH